MAFNESLFDAAMDGELDECQALILKNSDVNWKNPQAVVYYTQLITDASLIYYIACGIHFCACEQSDFDCFECRLVFSADFTIIFARTIVLQCMRQLIRATPM